MPDGVAGDLGCGFRWLLACKDVHSDDVVSVSELLEP